MVARDEEICCGMTVETAKDVIDELVFVDNSSKDKTAEVVRAKCKEFSIILHEYKADLSYTVEDLRWFAFQQAKKYSPDWCFTCDGDTVFNTDKLNIRKLLESGKYDQYWFKTLNLYGDLEHSSGMNIPHLYVFRNKNGVIKGENYVCSTKTHSSDPNRDRFAGWNLNGIKTCNHMFWRNQIWFYRLWNKHHGTNLGVEGFIKAYFNGQPSDYYKKTFVLNRMRIQTLPVETIAAHFKMNIEEFKKQYMDFPKCLKEWDNPFKLIMDNGGKMIGRKPDLMNVPLLPNEKIEQLHPKRLNEFRSWRK